MHAPPGGSGGVRSEAQARNKIQHQGGRNDDEAFRRIQELSQGLPGVDRQQR